MGNKKYKPIKYGKGGTMSLPGVTAELLNDGGFVSAFDAANQVRDKSIRQKELEAEQKNKKVKAAAIGVTTGILNVAMPGLGSLVGNTVNTIGESDQAEETLPELATNTPDLSQAMPDMPDLKMEYDMQEPAVQLFKGGGRKMYGNGGKSVFETVDMGHGFTELKGHTHEDGGMNIQEGIEVEGGETIYNDFVFTNSHKVPASVAKRYGLKGAAGKTYAQASKTQYKYLKERPNDPYAKDAFDEYMSKLEQAHLEGVPQSRPENIGMENMNAAMQGFAPQAKNGGKIVWYVNSLPFEDGGSMKYDSGGYRPPAWWYDYMLEAEGGKSSATSDSAHKQVSKGLVHTNRGITWATWQNLAGKVLNVQANRENFLNLTEDDAKKFLDYYWDQSGANKVSHPELAVHLAGAQWGGGNKYWDNLTRLVNEKYGTDFTEYDSKLSPELLSYLDELPPEEVLGLSDEISNLRTDWLTSLPNQEANYKGWTNRQNTLRSKIHSNYKDSKSAELDKRQEVLDKQIAADAENVQTPTPALRERDITPNAPEGFQKLNTRFSTPEFLSSSHTLLQDFVQEPNDRIMPGQDVEYTGQVIPWGMFREDFDTFMEDNDAEWSELNEAERSNLYDSYKAYGFRSTKTKSAGEYPVSAEEYKNPGSIDLASVPERHRRWRGYDFDRVAIRPSITNPFSVFSSIPEGVASIPNVPEPIRGKDVDYSFLTEDVAPTVEKMWVPQDLPAVTIADVDEIERRAEEQEDIDREREVIDNIPTPDQPTITPSQQVDVDLTYTPEGAPWQANAPDEDIVRVDTGYVPPKTGVDGTVDPLDTSWLRYAPVAADIGNLIATISDRPEELDPSDFYVDEVYDKARIDKELLQRETDQQAADLRQSIVTGATSQGALQAGIAAISAGTAKAKTEAVMKGQLFDAQQQQLSEQFRAQAQARNMQTKLAIQNINDANRAAWTDAKSDAVSSLGMNLGAIGKEQLDLNTMEATYGVDPRTGKITNQEIFNAYARAKAQSARNETVDHRNKTKRSN